MTLESLRRDLSCAARLLWRTPALTVPAVLSLALGIGVNTVLFSLVNAALLRPIEGSQGAALVRIGRSVGGDGSFRSISMDDLRVLRAGARSFSAVAGHQLESFALTTADGAETVSVETVTGNYFSVLGVGAIVGRTFAEGEDSTAAAPAVVISERFWRRRLAGTTAAVGSPIRLNGEPFTIVGVAARGFVGTFPGVDVDVWLPVSWVNAIMNRADGREPTLMLLARLQTGSSVATARAELGVIASRFAGDDTGERRRGFSIAPARGIHPGFARVVRAFVLLLMAVVAVVLLVACANVSGMLLARASARQGELAMRVALGAGRARILTQLLVESVLLALAGGLAGLFLAYWPVRLLNSVTLAGGPSGGAIFFNLQLDVRVLLFTLAATLMTTLGFGLAPALRASRVDLVSVLKDSAATAGVRRSRLRSAVMIAQVSLTCVLLVGAALLSRALYNASHMDLGFDPGQVVIAPLDLRMLGASRPRTEAFYGELLRRVRQQPGTLAASLADFIPMADPGAGRLRVPGPSASPSSPDHGQWDVPYGVISDSYFATVGQPLLRGRDFTAGDAAGAAPVVIINEAMARRAFPSGSNPIGQRLRLAREEVRDYEVVGVARDARFWSLSGAIEPLVLLPASQQYTTPLVLHVRAAAPASRVAADVRRLASEIDRTVPVAPQAMHDGMGFTLIPLRVAQVVFGVAGLIALLMAAVGVYGLVWHSVEQRVKEIGVRLALGATRAGVLRLVVGGALRLTAIGVGIGAVVAAGAGRLLSSILVGVSATDPGTFGGIAALLGLVTLAAGYAAARKALAVDPVVALRHE